MEASQNAPDSVRAVFFDCGSTLLDPEPNVDAMFVEVARRRGYELSLEQVALHMAAIDAYYEMQYMKDGSFWASPDRAVGLWYDIYRLMCHLTGVTDDVEGMAHEMFQEYLKADSWMVYPDVAPALRGLKERGLRLAVVSNWDPSLLSLLRDLGLLPYFDEVLASAEVGYRKPEAAIFEIACERLRLPPSACVHVGDNVEADGDGAAGAGIRPVIIDRRKRMDQASRCACAYPVIDDLSSLSNLL